jgi:pantothenate kinase
MPQVTHSPSTLPLICQQRITSLLATGVRKIIGIVAPPGAGKSTLAQALTAQFGAAVQVVPMDGFHLANSELERLGRRSRKGAPDTFDAAGYVNLLRRLKNQAADELVYAPDYRREIEEGVAGALPISAQTPLIVTEGNYLLLPEAPWNQVPNVVDEIWYLAVPQSLRIERLLARHRRFGRSRQEGLDWIASTDEPNAVRIAQCQHRADVVMDWV